MTKKELLKKIVRILMYTVLIMLSVPALIFLALKNPKVQTFVVHEITQILSDKLNTRISIESVNYAFFNKLRITKVYVQDQHKDTLLYTDNLYASIRGFSFKKRTISLGTVKLEKGKLYLKQDSTRVLNLHFIIEAFKSKDTTRSKKEYAFKVHNLMLKDFHFKYRKWDPPYHPHGMNYADLDIKRIELDLRDIKVNGSHITANMKNLSAYEKCGFLLNHLGADIDFSPKQITLNKATIITPDSKVNTNHIIFRFNGFKAWLDYVKEVYMDADFNHSLVDFKTIAYFAPTLSKWTFKGYIDGRVRGPVADLRSKNFEYHSIDSTYLAVNFAITGLPHADETIWKGSVQQLRSNGSELGQLIKTFAGAHGEQVAGIIGKLGSINLTAAFKGKFAAFESSADVRTSIGSTTAALSTTESQGHTNSYRLTFGAKDLNLGKLLHLKSFGNLTATLTSTGSTTGRLINSSTSNLQAAEVQVNGYSYRNVSAEITREGKSYSLISGIASRDAALALSGSYDFEGKLPKMSASARIDHINPYNLHLVGIDTIKSIKGLLSLNLEGNNLDDMNGSITLNQATLRSSKKEIPVGYSNLRISNSITGHSVRISSDLLDASLTGNRSLKGLGGAINHFTRLYLPVLAKATGNDAATVAQPTPAATPATATYDDFRLNIHFKKANEALSLFIPMLRIENGTVLTGSLNTALNKADLKLRSNDIQLKGNHFHKVNLQAIGSPDDLRTFLSCDQLQSGEVIFKNIDITGVTRKDQVNTSVAFNNSDKQSRNEGSVRFITRFERNPENRTSIKVNFLKSDITINDTKWNVGNAQIYIDSTSLDIEDFKITNKDQKIAVAGKISEKSTDQLHFIINNIDIQNFRPFFNGTGYDIQGALNGIATLKGTYKTPMLFSNIKLDDAYINGRSVGSPELISSWDDETKKVNIYSTNSINDKEVYNISGTFAPESKEINLKVKVDQLRAFLIEPYTKGVVSDMRGFISANLNVRGKISDPEVEGTAFLNNISAKVNFLNTTYSINAPVKISPGEISIKNDTLFDPLGHRALVNASITHSYLRDFKFDISINPDNIMALNTGPRQNDIFFGNAYASGVVKIQGDTKNLQMRINAQTEKGTKVIIPLNNKTAIQDQNFITFVNPNSDIVDFTPGKKKETQKPRSNMKIFLDLNVNTNAETQIILDPNTGSMIKAQGNSSLSMEVDPSTNLFQIRGTYTIQKGNFKFNLLNLTSKEFSIDNGSSITWTGDAANANINVTATYKVRASLLPLLASMGQTTGNQRYNIDCKIYLTGPLLNPIIKFDIKIPEADATVQTLVATQLHNESQMQKQVISLLWAGQFFPEQSTDNSNNDAFATAGKGMASDLILNQLTNIVSQLSNSIDIGLKYSPATATTEQEYEVSFSKNLFNDWVKVNGVVDVSGNKSTGQGIAGDYDVEVRLDKKDRLKFKMFSYDQQDNMLKQNISKRGVGITYQEQFESFKDLFKRKKKRKKEEQKPDSAIVSPDKKRLKQPQDEHDPNHKH